MLSKAAISEKRRLSDFGIYPIPGYIASVSALEPKHGRQYQELASRLRLARRRAGLTQAAAAHALSRPQSFVAKCESGERRVDFLELKAFASLYDTSLTFFETEEPGPSHDNPSEIK